MFETEGLDLGEQTENESNIETERGEREEKVCGQSNWFSGFILS